MSDYSPSLVDEHVVRNYFDPPLSESDLTKASLLVHIESVEQYIEDVYELTSSAKIPALLLVISRIINLPSIAKKHYTVRRETIRNYSYELDTSSSPNVVSLTLEKAAERMLNAKSYVHNDKLKVFGRSRLTYLKPSDNLHRDLDTKDGVFVDLNFGFRISDFSFRYNIFNLANEDYRTLGVFSREPYSYSWEIRWIWWN